MGKKGGSQVRAHSAGVVGSFTPVKYLPLGLPPLTQVAKKIWKANGHEGSKALNICSRKAWRGKGSVSKPSFAQPRGYVGCRGGGGL